MWIVQGISKKKDDVWKNHQEIFLQTSKDENISLITSKGYDSLTQDIIKGFCHFKFKANFVIKGIDLEKITINTLLTIGDAVIKITEIEKKCHQQCPAFTKNHSCTLGQQIFFGKVVQEGLVKKGAKVNI
ncbi:MOSC domain-containing protein [Natronincola ferrireducens]|uniref:MOSC domain-containing protein n=1 Tax=Natronincola ferrireducens TaxID=393762 RepID=A0A1G9HF58_9FIRM|nr:hypothetical protein [Natronincola ferrireducens]SDL11547.1 hypothetical protein SAMN05660472_02648 [Natronincola ferrireducens]